LPPFCFPLLGWHVVRLRLWHLPNSHQPYRLAEAMIAFHRAQREDIPSLAEEEIRLCAISLTHESERVNDVARDTIKEILLGRNPSVIGTTARIATGAAEANEIYVRIVGLLPGTGRHCSGYLSLRMTRNAVRTEFHDPKAEA
jgi:hypothetical protein